MRKTTVLLQHNMQLSY